MPKTVKPEIVVRRLTKALAAAEDEIAELKVELAIVKKAGRVKLKRARDVHSFKLIRMEEKHEIQMSGQRGLVRTLEAQNAALRASDELFKQTYPEQWARLNLVRGPHFEVVPDTPERRAAFSRKLAASRGKDVLAYPDR